jgi:hypothetical protein
MYKSNLEYTKIVTENKLNQLPNLNSSPMVSLPPISPNKCISTCTCITVSETYHCPLRIVESNNKNWSVRKYSDSLKEYHKWEEQNIYADIPPLLCTYCELALTIGGWLYDRQFPTLSLCECQYNKTMTPG